MGITASTLETLGIDIHVADEDRERLIQRVKVEGMVGPSAALVIVSFCDRDQYCHPWRIIIIDSDDLTIPSDELLNEDRTMLYINLKEWGCLTQTDSGMAFFSGLPAFAAAGSALILREAMSRVEFQDPVISSVEFF